MRLRLARQAVRDLQNIADFIGAESPSGAKRVRAAIVKTLQLIGEHPDFGRIQSLKLVRKAVVPKYRYLIYYRVDSVKGEVVVLSVRHPARRRAADDA